MASTIRKTSWSFQATLVFWWIVFLAVQQTQRLFLLIQTVSVEVPREGILMKTLVTGLRADLITATLGIGIAVGLAGILGALRMILARFRNIPKKPHLFARVLMGTSLFVGLVLFVILTIDMGYFGFNGQHLDFVFLEYLRDMFDQSRGQNQAALQTQAELGDSQKWIMRVVAYLTLEGLVIALLWFAYRRRVGPALNDWTSTWPRTTSILLALTLGATATGLHPDGWWSIQRAGISSSVYYTLAQNPVLFTTGIISRSLDFQGDHVASEFSKIMPLDEAVQTSRQLIGSDENFPYPQYPWVREIQENKESQFEQLPNVLMIFVEGLDRRFLGLRVSVDRDSEDDDPILTQAQANTGGHSQIETPIEGIQVTPFLDSLKLESVYFENFYSNGAKTSRGLFATLCSSYPSRGWSVMKTRYTFDYLCFPSLLRRAGYRTEMVIGQNRDRGHEHIGLFLARNGVQEMFDESDFPPDAERLGLGMTDTALFEFVRNRLEVLQRADQPFFLTTLTVGTHHPFTVPLTHPDVRTLQKHPDGYIAALRYLDLAFDQFFEGARQDGLLKNTVVVILGDHGRHERLGHSVVEEYGGRFLVPLFLWFDPSLRTSENYRPRIISTVASQVDVGPTILGLNGLMPRFTPFVGHDLSCLLISDCVHDNVAFLNSVYDDVIALVDSRGFSLYSYPRDKLYLTDFSLHERQFSSTGTALDVSTQRQQLLALDISSNVLLEQNRVWSWREFGDKL